MKKLIPFLVIFCVIFLSACGSTVSDDVPETDPETMTFSEIKWPDTDIAKLMPVPKSNAGNIDWSEEYGFVIHIAETSPDDFDDYADECEKLGFTENLRRGDSYIFADNSDGYHISVKLDDGNVMFVRIDQPKNTADDSTEKSVEENPSDEKAEPVENVCETSEPDQPDISEKTVSEQESDNVKLPGGDRDTATGDFENTDGKVPVKLDEEKSDSSSVPSKSVGDSGPDNDPANSPVTVPEGSEEKGDLVWVPTKGGKKYHSRSSCSKMIDPIQVSRETATANGYTPCGKCY